MKFTIETGTLKEGLDAVSVGMTGRTTLPILGNVKIDAAEDVITLSTTNLDIYVTQKVPAKVSKAGAVTVPFDLFARLVGRISASRITVAAVENAIEFKGGDVAATIETLPAHEFPDPLMQSGSPTECDASAILKPFNMLSYSICKDETRWVLQGISIAPSESGGSFVAIAGPMFAIYKGEHVTDAEVIVPEGFVRAVRKLQPEGAISLLVSDGAINLESQSTRIQGKLIEGRFPNWREIVPERSDIALSCGRKPLIEALRTCSIFTDGQIRGLRVTGKSKEVEVSLPEKAVATVLGSELAGQPDISFRINSAHLIDTLSVLDSDDVRIQVKDRTSPVMIEDGPFTAVINVLQDK